MSGWYQSSAIPSPVFVSAFYSWKKWSRLLVFLQGSRLESHPCDLLPPRWQTGLCLSCSMKFLRTEKAVTSSSALCRQTVWIWFRQWNGFLTLKSLMALIQPSLTFAGWGARSRSLRFTKDLAALAWKDEIVLLQNQGPSARYPLSPLFCRALPFVSVSCPHFNKSWMKYSPAGLLFPTGVSPVWWGSMSSSSHTPTRVP